MEVNSKTTHIGHWVKVLNHLMVTESNRTLKSFGLTRGSWYILYHVNKETTISQKKLQDILGIKSGTMAIVVDGLVRKGWLDRTSNEKDRRANYLKFTPEGAARWKTVPDILSIYREKMMKDITNEEEEIVVTILKKCWINLNNEDPSQNKSEIR